MAVVTAANASSFTMSKIEDCHRVLTQKNYDATGARLVVIKSADLLHFPRGFLCKACSGAGGFEAFVAEDGSVGLAGVDHIGWEDGSIWRIDILSKRITAMRYVPPRVAGNPVCVAFDLNWVSQKPNVLTRWDKQP
ncbi:MAG TPA: hypothetical protein VN932_05115 [Rhizomicrobium sp.]|nr:hypothetical protein [Rhizomicrobium sp.]